MRKDNGNKKSFVRQRERRMVREKKRLEKSKEKLKGKNQISSGTK